MAKGGGPASLLFLYDNGLEDPRDHEPFAMTLYLVNLERVRVFGIDDEALVPEVHIELECSLVGCPTCGVVAVVKDRHPVPVVDRTMAGRKIVLVRNKRRFRSVVRIPEFSNTQSGVFVHVSG